jgi:predicted O-linked N-acetylglucosamine transferase (SPINDLY family)
MLNVIAKILQKVPYACYAPIGAINQKERFYNCFKTYGVEKQYIPIGHSLHPSFVARHMHLYLNEFPVGSCLGMLDAMSSGIPVVSMFDLNGPQQSRYGGEFMGQDYVIKTNDPNDYVELAVKLLTDNIFYNEWVEHTRKRYGLFSDVKAYVSSLEELLLAQYWG